MDSGINITAILIANILGLTLMLMIIASNRWRFKIKSAENNLLMLFIVMIIISCIVDPIDFIADGKPGMLCRVLVYGGNLWLYFSNMILGPAWISFLCIHLDVKLSKRHRMLLIALIAAGTLLIVVNFFTPIVFSVDAGNVYHRGQLFFVYTLMEILLLGDSIAIYAIARKKGGVLKFFPVWIFILPLLLGIILQFVFYGISTIWPCIAISCGGVMASLQNELIFRDRLTGLFNRFYLDNIKEEIGNSDKGHFTAMMLDLNAFKQINDNYGHSEGDEALIASANVIKNAVGGLGSVIRYAGDEFVVLLNTQEDKLIDECIADVHRGFEEFNEKSGKPYKLSISIGSCKLDLSQMTVDGLLNEIDRLMYENKKAYYIKNDRRRR